MEPLVRFSELTPPANGDPAKPEVTTGAVPDQIERLHHRLASGEFRDSVEVTIAIVGELVYQTYKDLITRRRYL